MSDKIDVAFFLPTRLGSNRVLNKNTRPFANIEGGLFELKITQLIKSRKISQILVSSNDPVCMSIAERFSGKDSRILIIERPNELCLDSTNLSDLIEYVPTITNAEHILWGHTTTPMADEKIYDKAIEVYQDRMTEGYDSLLGVCSFQNFILNESGKVVNNGKSNLDWPRTQDLEVLYELNHSVFLTNRRNYVEHGNRVGKKPYLFEMDKIHSIDVDWEDDFAIAEALYEKFS